MRTVLRNAVVIDGSREASAHRADVALEDDRIVEVGGSITAAGGRELDLDGLVLAPGFIDPHTHYDAQILWDPDLTPSSWHGVTTTVMGNCGFSIAPTRREHRGVICRTLENVEGMSVEALEAGIDWSFETFPEWLDTLRAVPKRLNVASMIGHTPLRLYVMGDAATERAATPDEARSMRRAVAEAIESGAVGFATSRSPSHQGDAGRPVPSRHASDEEVAEVALGLRDAGRGILQATPGPGLFMEELSALSVKLGRPVTWTAILTRSGVPWPSWAEDGVRGAPMETLRRQQSLPGDVWPQISCRDLVMQVVLTDPFPFGMLPAFKEILGVPHADRARLYADPDWQDRARPEMDSYWGHRWGKTTVQETNVHHDLVDVNLAELAKQRGQDPFDLFISLSLAEDLGTRFKIVIANDDEDEVTELLREPGALLALSDAGAHASQLSDACYSTHLLGHWVREKRALSLEEAVWKLSGQVAGVFEIPDRGYVREGYFADLVAFDPATVAPGSLERVHDLPAGADRLVSRSEGVRFVWVNGTLIIDSGAQVEVGDYPGVLVGGRE